MDDVYGSQLCASPILEQKIFSTRYRFSLSTGKERDHDSPIGLITTTDNGDSPMDKVGGGDKDAESGSILNGLPPLPPHDFNRKSSTEPGGFLVSSRV